MFRRNAPFERFWPCKDDAVQVSAGEDSAPSYVINFRCDLGQVAGLFVLCCPKIKPEVVIPTGLRGERYATEAAFPVRSLRAEAVE